MRGGRQRVEIREDRRDTFTTEDVDAFRRELLASHLSPRSAQKILVLLHALFKLAKRRKLVQSNPSQDAERVSLTDPGTFNILEPVEFEAVYRALLALDEDPVAGDREMYAALLATTFYAGLRLGELLDLPWQCVDFDRSLIRVESGYTHGSRSTPKGKKARSTPMVPVLAQRLAELSTRRDFVGESDYVFANPVGQRVRDANVRAVFYAALDRAGFAHRRAERDQHGSPQAPIRLHDLRHSWCTWAVNVWPVTKVQHYAGHRDIQTTMRYVHHQTKAEDADLGGAYLDRVLTPTAAAADTVAKKYRDVVRALRDAGWEHTRTRGSHELWRHPDGREVVIPGGGKANARSRQVRLPLSGEQPESTRCDDRVPRDLRAGRRRQLERARRRPPGFLGGRHARGRRRVDPRGDRALSRGRRAAALGERSRHRARVAGQCRSSTKLCCTSSPSPAER